MTKKKKSSVGSCCLNCLEEEEEEEATHLLRLPEASSVVSSVMLGSRRTLAARHCGRDDFGHCL